MNKNFFIIDAQFIQKNSAKQNLLRIKKKSYVLANCKACNSYVVTIESCSLKLQNLQIADIAAINYEAHGCANLMKPFISGSSRVNMQTMEFRIKNYFQDV